MSKDKITPLLIPGKLFKMKREWVFADEEVDDIFLVLTKPKIQKYDDPTYTYYQFQVFIRGKKLVFSYASISPLSTDPHYYLEEVL